MFIVNKQLLEQPLHLFVSTFKFISFNSSCGSQIWSCGCLYFILTRPRSLWQKFDGAGKEIQTEENGIGASTTGNIYGVNRKIIMNNVKEVTINSLNILYKNGLSILNHEVVNENGYIKLKINLEGTQSEFNFSNITNGTNIVLNANIKVNLIIFIKY